MCEVVTEFLKIFLAQDLLFFDGDRQKVIPG